MRCAARAAIAPEGAASTESACAACVGVATCATDSACAASEWCDLATTPGKCAAKKANGASCAAANVCTSALCVDGVCCDTTCTAKCMACSAAKKGASACSRAARRPPGNRVRWVEHGCLRVPRTDEPRAGARAPMVERPRAHATARRLRGRCGRQLCAARLRRDEVPRRVHTRRRLRPRIRLQRVELRAEDDGKVRRLGREVDQRRGRAALRPLPLQSREWRVPQSMRAERPVPGRLDLRWHEPLRPDPRGGGHERRRRLRRGSARAFGP